MPQLLLPLVLPRSDDARIGQKDFGDFLLKARRFSIFAIMVMAYFYYRALGNTQLVAIGLLSFAAITQLGAQLTCEGMVTELIDATVNQMPHDEGKRDTRRQHVLRAIESLTAGNAVRVADGKVGVL